MMSLQAIRDLSEQAAKRAKRERKLPMVFSETQRAMLADGEIGPVRCIPNLGDYRPKGWKLVDEHFVDSSGFGSAGEPAMTIGDFCKLVAKHDADRGWGLTQEGQFQVYVGEFELGGDK